MRRVVVDLQHVMLVEGVAAGEVVVARLELEVEEVGLGDETRLVERCRAQRRRLAFARARRFALGAMLAALLLAVEPLLLVLAAIALGNRHAVEAQGTADVNALAHVPRVLAADAGDRRAAGTEHLDAFHLVEDVIAERAAIDVAFLERARHQRVEVARRCRGRRRSGGWWW